MLAKFEAVEPSEDASEMAWAERETIDDAIVVAQMDVDWLAFQRSVEQDWRL